MTSVSTDRRFGVNSGKAVKVPCKVATTANITLSGEQTIDGVSCVTDDRVLVRTQTTGSENGIWVVDTGAWSRALDFDDVLDVTEGTIIPINRGSTYSTSVFRVDTTGTITPGTTSITFSLSSYFDVSALAPVENFAALRVVNTSALSSGDVVYVKSHTTLGDGGFGYFRYIEGAAPATYTDNNGTIVVPTGGDGSAAFLREYSGAINVEWFGATGDGITNDRTSFSNADAVGEMIVPSGNYLISSSLSFSNKVTFLKGAILVIPNGVTVTFNAGISASVYKIFTLSGTGTVVFDPSFISHGYSEWYGAATDDGSAGVASANLTAINNALAAIPKVEFMPADYYVSGTVKHQRAHCWMMGAGSNYDGTYGTRATRLLVTDGSTNTLQVGPDANPGSISQFTLGLKLTGMHVARTVAPVIASGCRSILVQFTTKAYFEDVQAHDSMISWEFNGTVSNRLFNCMAKRTSAGTGAGTESWKGYYINGNSGIAAGGNASLYISYSNADDTRATVTNGYGFYFDNDFTDCFLSWCETVTCTAGIVVTGNSGAGVDLGNTDLHISHCINDSTKTYGILIQDLADAGSIDIDGCYFGPSDLSSYALFIQNSDASVNVAGGQFVMGATTTTVPIAVSSATGVRVSGSQIMETLTNTCVVLANANNCNIQPIIKNRSNAAGAAVQLSGTCTANYIAPTVLGKAAGVTFGIQVVGVADDRNEYNCTGIDSATVNGGAGNKLVRNGVQIVATGLTGTNLASGVMT